MATKHKKGKENPDPVFQAEMAAISEERRAAFNGTFIDEWRARKEKGIRPIAPSRLHLHDEGCFEKDSRPLVYEGPSLTTAGRRCKKTGSIVVVASWGTLEARRLGLVHGDPVPARVLP